MNGSVAPIMRKPPESRSSTIAPGEIPYAPPIDDRGHAELLLLYRDAARNILFAKAHQWQMLVYFTVICAAVIGIGVYLGWRDSGLIALLFYATWLSSVATVVTLVFLQIWQGAEHRKIAYIVHRFGDAARATLKRKSRSGGDFHRYLMLGLMMLYVELASLAVSRMLWPRF